MQFPQSEQSKATSVMGIRRREVLKEPGQESGSELKAEQQKCIVLGML